MAEKNYTFKDFKSDQQVRWCPGCGNHAILAALQRAMPEVCKGLSYDLETVIKVVSGRADVTLDIAGNGPDRERLERLGTAANIRFHGYLGENDLRTLLSKCDVGIIPMFPESCVGVPGKLADYAAAGLRVIESLGCETYEIVERYRVGVHYKAGNAVSLSSAIEQIRNSACEGGAFKYFGMCFDATVVMDGYVGWIERL